VEHEGADHALHDGAVGLAEALRRVAARRVRQEHLRRVHGRDVVRQRQVVHLEVLVGPLAEEHGRRRIVGGHDEEGRKKRDKAREGHVGVVLWSRWTRRGGGCEGATPIDLTLQ
jgi:hypothetical protein